MANRVPAFEFLEENNAGKIIPYLSSIQIKLAVDRINDNYDTLAANCKLLSKRYDNSLFTEKLIRNLF